MWFMPGTTEWQTLYTATEKSFPSPVQICWIPISWLQENAIKSSLRILPDKASRAGFCFTAEPSRGGVLLNAVCRNSRWNSSVVFIEQAPVSGSFFCLIYPFFLRDGTVFLFDGTPCLKIRFFRYFPVFLFDVLHISVKRMLKSRNTKGGATETVFNPFDTCV